MRAVSIAGLLLALVACKRDAPAKPLTKVDVHTHLSPGSLGHVLPMLQQQGIDIVVNLSGGREGQGLEPQLAAAKQHPGHVIVFCTPDLLSPQAPQELERLHALGCRGVKIFKALGLQLRWPDGSLAAVDDPRLDALFEKAGELKMPVAIHTGDPRAFWLPVTPQNERFDELSVHPGWALAGKPVPTWEQLLEQLERRVARHPRTTFIGLHFGNAAEEPKRVDAMLERNANLLVETSARIPELGRTDAAALRDLFIRRQDRIMFGTDLAAGDRPGELVLGSPGASLPSPADVTRFYASTWRFFETRDRGFEHPTAIQGRWTIDGIGLPREVLEKVYRSNAARLLGAP
ncbi:MAG: amidohydrolase family protein [Archangiaceae bacterium]|nr:amidohydrolase family protein [Archangiaceae bacterium]